MELQKSNVQSILIIDDDRDDYELVLEAIQEINTGIAVHFMSTCEEAMHSRHRSFDLVFLDINMPGYDGFHWLKSIRERGYTNLPVVMYSNSLSPAHIDRAYREGATLYFSKPESYTGLIRSLSELIKMDWSNPSSITAKYQRGGKYLTFQGSI